jgi:hypothetical protein
MMLAVLAGGAGGVAVANTDVTQFRVLPYVQNPQPTGMTVNWFTNDAVAGTITVTGPGLASPLVVNSTPELQPVLAYFPAEVSISPRPADMAAGNNTKHKHQAVLTGLQAGSVYSYTVTQGVSTFSGTFKTAPVAGAAVPVRITALSDSETLIIGRTTKREWSRQVPQLPGSTGRPAGTGPGRDAYVMTETAGYIANLENLKARTPDLIVMPGDIVQGTGGNEGQRRWDEFWRHNAGEYGNPASFAPIIAAIGNNCIFGGGSNQTTINDFVTRSRQQFSVYFDAPAAPQPAWQDLVHRVDYGPVTILTICSVGAMSTNDQQSAANPPAGVTRLERGVPAPYANVLDTNRAWLNAYTFGDLPDYNPGTAQFEWVSAQLAELQEAGRIVIMQWHHTPWSRGIHGSNVTSDQSGEAMRPYITLAEQFGVAMVLCGHSEVPERSFIDSNNDGFGVNLYDVGNAGDGLRGVEDPAGFPANGNIVTWRNNPNNPEGQNWVPNPFSRWTSDQSEPELWDGNRLLAGGKHYGFLEIDVTPVGNGRFRVELQPFHSFPITAGDAAFTVTDTVFRRYNDLLILEGTPGNLRRVVQCTTSDVAGANQNLTPDGQLTADDIIVYLGRFFGGEIEADVAGPNQGPFSDGELTADDVIVFLGKYFAGC